MSWLFRPVSPSIDIAAILRWHTGHALLRSRDRGGASRPPPPGHTEREASVLPVHPERRRAIRPLRAPAARLRLPSAGRRPLYTLCRSMVYMVLNRQ